jgi:hypothetical protein
LNAKGADARLLPLPKHLLAGFAYTAIPLPSHIGTLHPS